MTGTWVYKEWKATAYVRQTQRRKSVLTLWTCRPHIFTPHFWNCLEWQETINFSECKSQKGVDRKKSEVSMKTNLADSQLSASWEVSYSPPRCRWFCFHRSVTVASRFKVSNSPTWRQGLSFNPATHSAALISQVFFSFLSYVLYLDDNRSNPYWLTL